jgi:hypothetical protein
VHLITVLHVRLYGILKYFSAGRDLGPDYTGSFVPFSVIIAVIFSGISCIAVIKRPSALRFVECDAQCTYAIQKEMCQINEDGK